MRAVIGRRGKALVVVLPLVLVGLMLSGLLFASEPSAAQEAPPEDPQVRSWRQRIDAIRTQLRSESLDESIAGLIESQQYFFPGHQSGRKFEQDNLEEMFANRRSVKVLRQLAELPAPQRREKIVAMFDTLLSVHAKAMRTGLTHAEDPSTPANTQSLMATQLSLCLAMLDTAQLGDLDLLHEQFRRLDTFRAEIERRIAEHQDLYDPSLILVARHYYVPDRRFQLNVLALAARGVADAGVHKIVEQLCAGFPHKSLPVANWNAAMTGFTLRGWDRVKTDEPRDIRTLYEWPDSMYMNATRQEAVVTDLRAAVLGTR